jgi:hypothetical protein
LARSGTFFSLSLRGCPDGSNALAGLVQATNGTFYGTTSSECGSEIASGTTCDMVVSENGTVFSLSVGLGPFVEALTYSGKVGNTIEFLGQGFTSSTTVSFSGTPAPRKVVSGTYLTATVPNGATTGFCDGGNFGRQTEDQQDIPRNPADQESQVRPAALWERSS